MTFQFKTVWTEWFLGAWWWPIRKDFAFGVCLGPFHFIWRRSYD